MSVSVSERPNSSNERLAAGFFAPFEIGVRAEVVRSQWLILPRFCPLMDWRDRLSPCRGVANPARFALRRVLDSVNTLAGQNENQR